MGDLKRILIVDDEPKNQRVIKDFLAVLGHSSEPANDGLEALEKLKSGFDLVLLDVMMPGMDGLEVVRLMRENPAFADIPVIMVTVLDDKETRLRAVEAGANDFINKPIDRLELIVRMESLLKMKDAQDAIKRHQAELEETVAERTAKFLESNKQLNIELAERKRAEESLRESELKYRLLFDSAPIGIMSVNTEGEILEVNRFLLEILGSPGSEATKNINMLTFPPLLEAGVSALFKDCMATRRQMSGKIPYTSKWGKQIYLRTVVTPKLNEKGEVEGCQAIMEDVTLRKQTELALRESEGRYKSMSSLMRLMCDNVPDLLWAKDLEGKAIFVNKAVCEKLLGAHDTEEPIGKTEYYFAERMCKENPDDPNYFTFGETCVNSDAAVLSKMRPGRFDECGNVRGRFLVLDVYKAPFVDQNGVLIGTVGCGRDVTAEREADVERRRIEEAFRHSEKMLKTILSTSPVAISLIQDRKFVWTNEFGLKIFGYESEEGYLGQNTSVVYATQEEYERVGREVYTDLATGKIAQVNTQMVRKDGSVFDARIRTKLVDPSSPDNLAIAVITDITDDLRAQKEKEALQVQLMQAQKMEALGNLTAGIAHDFNNLLQVVLGYSEVMIQAEQENEAHCDQLRQINEAGKRGAKLVQRLMTFSRKAEPKFQSVNLNHEIIEMGKLLERAIPKTIKINLHLGHDLGVVQADVSQVGQIIMNLAVNARDAMPAGGTLTIETGNVVLDQAYCLRNIGVKPGCYSFITVSDTGHGMDKETLSHIFEPFFTTKGTGKGTGLGLAVVYRIVNNHGAHMTCYSEKGHGTTFKIHFPAIETEKLSEPKKNERPVRGGTETILLADDDDAIANFCKQLLSSRGYQVIVASNGKHALEIYKNNRDTISLVILDLIMPKMDGRQCLSQILRVNPDVKVILSSGYSETGSASGATAEARGYIQKPYDMRQLLTMIREVLDNDVAGTVNTGR